MPRYTIPPLAVPETEAFASELAQLLVHERTKEAVDRLNSFARDKRLVAWEVSAIKSRALYLRDTLKEAQPQ